MYDYSDGCGLRRPGFANCLSRYTVEWPPGREWKHNYRTQSVERLRLRQTGRHFADDIFKCIVLNGNIWISIKISLKFVPEVRINNIPALVQTRRQAIIWTNDDLDYWRIYASLGFNELNGVYHGSLVQGTNFLIVYSQENEDDSCLFDRILWISYL